MDAWARFGGARREDELRDVFPSEVNGRSCGDRVEIVWRSRGDRTWRPLEDSPLCGSHRTDTLTLQLSPDEDAQPSRGFSASTNAAVSTYCSVARLTVAEPIWKAAWASSGSMAERPRPLVTKSESCQRSNFVISTMCVRGARVREL